MANPDDLVFDDTMDEPIGAKRFANRISNATKPLNELPEGEDPAGWFIDPIRNLYINCDGKTPAELAEVDPKTLKQHADAAITQRDIAYQKVDTAVQRAEEAERQLAELQKKIADGNTTAANVAAILDSEGVPSDKKIDGPVPPGAALLKS